MEKKLLLGNEVCAQAAADAAVAFAFGYPGTPSSEIMEHLTRIAADDHKITAQWCANEKSAFERAMGVSFGGKRVCVIMKHVGLNVAMDAFVNAA